jgi:TRAP-type C4-dicarboxylate transport system permease small subunit
MILSGLLNTTKKIVVYPAPYLIAVIKWAIVGCLVSMCIAVFGQVVYRKVLEGSIPWSEELARYLFVWMVWLGASLGVYYKTHFGIDLLVKKLPVFSKRFVNAIVIIAGVLFLTIAISKGFSLAIDNWYQKSPAMRIPMTIPYLSVPVGCFLMLYFWITSVLTGGKSK